MCRETIDGDLALRHGVDVSVGGEQRCGDEGAALEVLGVADCTDSDVNVRALGGKRWKGCRDKDCRDVAA